MFQYQRSLDQARDARRRFHVSDVRFERPRRCTASRRPVLPQNVAEGRRLDHVAQPRARPLRLDKTDVARRDFARA